MQGLWFVRQVQSFRKLIKEPIENSFSTESSPLPDSPSFSLSLSLSLSPSLFGDSSSVMTRWHLMHRNYADVCWRMLTCIASKRICRVSFVDPVQGSSFAWWILFIPTDAKLKLIWKYEKYKIINDFKNRIGFGGRQWSYILSYTSQVSCKVCLE